MTSQHLAEKFGQWAIYPDIAIGVGAARKQPTMTDKEYRRGMLLVLVASDLDQLAAKLERQTALFLDPRDQPSATATAGHAPPGPSAERRERETGRHIVS